MAQMNVDAFRQGAQMYDNALVRERQAKQDAMTEERFGWERDKQARERTAFGETQRLAGEGRAMFEEQPAAPYGALTGQQAQAAPVGHEAQDAAATNPVEVNAVQSPAANPAENNLATGLQKGFRQLESQGKMIRHAYDLAVVNNDRQGMLGAMEAWTSLNERKQLGRIAVDTLQNPERWRHAVRGLVSAHPSLEASFRPDGATLKDKSGAEVNLTVPQLVMMTTSLFRMGLGKSDEAYKDLAGIDKSLADMVKAANNHQETLAKSHNDALKLGGELDEKSARVGYYGALAGKAQAEAEQKAHIGSVSEALFREQHPNATAAQLAAVRAGINPLQGDKNLGREERMRYTTLLNDTGRRLTDAQKTLAALQKDYMYASAKPGSAQHAELQGLRDNIALLSEERKGYQRLLAEAPAASSSRAAPAAPAGAAQGAPSAAPAGGDETARLRGDLAAVDREIARAKASNTVSASAKADQLATYAGEREKIVARLAQAERQLAQVEQQTAAPAADGSASSIPGGAIKMLQGNPSLAADFDRKYGAGASSRYLATDSPAAKPQPQSHSQPAKAAPAAPAPAPKQPVAQGKSVLPPHLIAMNENWAVQSALRAQADRDDAQFARDVAAESQAALQNKMMADGRLRLQGVKLYQ